MSGQSPTRPSTDDSWCHGVSCSYSIHLKQQAAIQSSRSPEEISMLDVDPKTANKSTHIVAVGKFFCFEQDVLHISYQTMI